MSKGFFMHAALNLLPSLENDIRILEQIHRKYMKTGQEYVSGRIEERHAVVQLEEFTRKLRRRLKETRTMHFPAFYNKRKWFP